MSERVEVGSPTRQGAADRINSWKGIAAYLGREQRTVQRWEQSEGLPVHRLQHGKAGSVYALKSELDAWMSNRSSRPLAEKPRKLRPHLRKVSIGAIVSVVALAAAGAFFRSRQSPDPNAPAPVTLTSYPGIELDPRLSPNGKQVAYTWNGEAEDNFDIYIRTLAGGAFVRLTTDPEQDYSPAWSPDGSGIAFLRRTGAREAAVLLVPALGGAERRITAVRSAAWSPWSRPGPFLAWSPDGKWLVTSGSQGLGWGDVLLCISLETGGTQALTALPSKAMADIAPAFSPNGRTIAFSRLFSWGRSGLYLLPVTEALLPAGDARELKTGSTWNASPAWSPDGGSVIFSTGSMDAPHLARIGIAQSAVAQRLVGAGDYGWLPSVVRGPDGRVSLGYAQHFESVNIWRNSLDGSGAPVRLIASAHRSYEPAWSPDGKRIVFLSDRTGYAEIWVADADGRHAEQWTSLKQPQLGSPRWSPDGRRIAFTAPGPQGSSIHVIDAAGAVPRQISGSEESGYLDWAHDGRAIYFSSNRGTGYDVWKIVVQGGDAVRQTYYRGRVPAASSDGRYLYYLKMVDATGRNDLWRMPLAGGAEEKVLEFVDAYSLSDAGIAFKYYRPGQQPVGPYLEFLRFDTGKIERLPAPPQPIRYGIAVSRDGRYMLHAQADFEVSDLMLIEDFR